MCFYDAILFSHCAITNHISIFYYEKNGGEEMIPLWVIILIVLWIILTEILFFAVAREEYPWGDSFLEKKFSSAAISFVTIFVVVGFPTLLAFAPNDGGTIWGWIVYAWYYGIALAGVIFVSINYVIYQWLEKC